MLVKSCEWPSTPTGWPGPSLWQRIIDARLALGPSTAQPLRRLERSNKQPAAAPLSLIQNSTAHGNTAQMSGEPLPIRPSLSSGACAPRPGADALGHAPRARSYPSSRICVLVLADLLPFSTRRLALSLASQATTAVPTLPPPRLPRPGLMRLPRRSRPTSSPPRRTSGGQVSSRRRPHRTRTATKAAMAPTIRASSHSTRRSLARGRRRLGGLTAEAAMAVRREDPTASPTTGRGPCRPRAGNSRTMGNRNSSR